MDKRYYAGQDIVDAIIGFMDAFGAMKEADVVEVVRCKDCKYLNSDIAMGEWEGSCRYWNTHSVMLNDFCSYGERKEG